MHRVFSSFFLSLFDEGHIDKIASFDRILRAVSQSPLLLDSILCALFEYNIRPNTVITSVDQHLNQQFIDNDWRNLSSPSILKYPDEKLSLLFDGHLHRPIDRCIFELTFTHSTPQEIYESYFINFSSQSTFFNLSKKAQATFVDSLLLHYSHDPLNLIHFILISNRSFSSSIFRPRNEFSLLKDAFSYDMSNFDDYIQGIEQIYKRLIDVDSILSFFIACVLPYADSFPYDFIEEIIKSPIFPSSSKYFPIEEFIHSTSCRQELTFKVLFDVCKRGDYNDLITQCFEREGNITKLLNVLLTSPIELCKQLSPLFVNIISNADSISPEEFIIIVETHKIQSPNVICDFLIEAVQQNANPNLMLYHPLLDLILDLVFVTPKKALRIYVGDTVTQEESLLNSTIPKSSITKWSMGLPENSWKPMCFVDVERKKDIDIIYSRENDCELSLFHYSSDLKAYQKERSITLPSANIQAVIPIDYYKTGYNDLLIVHSATNAPPYNISLLVNNKGTFSSTLEHLQIQSDSIPFVFDFSQTYTMDFLYKDSSTGKWRLFIQNEEFPEIYSIAAAQLTPTESINLIASTSKTQTKTEFTVFKFENFKWVKLQTFNGPPNSGEIAIGDFDKDGLLDIVFPVYPENESSYLCYMFNTNNGFQSDIECSNQSNSVKLEVLDIIPGIIPQIGDITLDGYPAVGIGVYDKSDDETQTAIILTQECKNCGSHEVVFVTRSSLPGLGGFFDLYQDGTLDYITNKGSFISTLATDSYFLKVTALNGDCLEWCSHGKSYPHPEPLSTIYNGATIHIQYTNKQGVKLNTTAVQRSTNGLTTPYWLFGLGDNAHYIEEVSVVSIGSDIWRWLMPNSHLFTTKSNQSRVFLLYKIKGFYVLFCFVLLLLVLGLFILILAKKEDEEDRKEADEMLPMF
ncbi:T-cell immunomodulatory protein [Histomonas meleagridis]|uniref:T-cell immunomodulatory protein n=1 Tax=Histomonas meleagridis TaxID=135588 RepID=UPI00355A92E5|nr:T-cell immunomodulatory protein [Histomonas meleagridis]KAH0800483.1 T-cell immunomodulatory protein [Histomonas meleagridis]